MSREARHYGGLISWEEAYDTALLCRFNNSEETLQEDVLRRFYRARNKVSWNVNMVLKENRIQFCLSSDSTNSDIIFKTGDRVTDRDMFQVSKLQSFAKAFVNGM